jgi:hypothetical protein
MFGGVWFHWTLRFMASRLRFLKCHSVLAFFWPRCVQQHCS